MTSPLPSYVIERLGNVRFLHQEAVDQARRPHPMSSLAILSFHDAIELFYVLALDYKSVQVNPKLQFDDYWRELSKEVSTLAGRRGMERLNRVRVSLKHHGSIPGTQQIKDARVDVEAFLAANVPAVFGVDYDAVTMADVVPQSAVRAKVKGASVAEASDDRKEAMGLLAEAFDLLFNPQYYTYVEPSPLLFGKSLTWLPRGPGKTATVLRWLRGDSKGGGYEDSRALAEQIDATTDAAAAAQAALRVMTLGVDYPRYLRFQQLTPRIDGTGGNPLNRSYPNRYAPSRGDFEYCEQFVIEFALRAAEVNAALEPPSWARREP